MLSRLLYLEPGQLRRAAPLFGLYLLLFAALTFADGLSLALFVQQTGADALPFYYGVSALAVLATTAWYMSAAGKYAGGMVFLAILAVPLLLFAAAWLAINVLHADARWLGLLFIGREVGFALVLLHFGTWLLDFFRREELQRVMPLIYSGGRIDGILGAAMLEHLSALVAPMHLLVLLAAMILLSMIGVMWLHRGAGERVHFSPRGDSETIDGGEFGATSVLQFAAFVWKSPLMFWITITSLLFFSGRTLLSFQYNAHFETAFASDVEMAQFLGRYTQYALLGSFLMQVLVVNRLVARWGIRGGQMLYAGVFFSATALMMLPMSLASAVFARYVENELRFGLRNPIAQMIVNLFPKSTRLMARAWSLGLLIPIATLAASGLMALVLRQEMLAVAGLITTAIGLGYWLGSRQLSHAIAGHVESPPQPSLPAVQRAVCATPRLSASAAAPT